jgi:hypothetical protein
LRFILEPTLDSWTKGDEERSYAVLSTQFVKNWRRWIWNPLEQQRPERIDNTQFFCHHELLTIDLNCPSDLDSSVTIIQRDEWNVLNSMYAVRVVSDFSVNFLKATKADPWSHCQRNLPKLVVISKICPYVRTAGSEG